MKYSSQQYAQALFEAINEVSSKDHDTVIENFVSMLREHNNLDQYEAIIEDYQRLDQKKRGVEPAEVTVAKEMPISGALLDQLNGLAQKKLEVTAKVDETIIGGVVLRMGDTLIDASVKTQLENLKKSLIK